MEVYILFQILFADAVTQQIIRHTIVNTKEEAEKYLQNFIRSKDIDEDIILFDYEKQTNRARFVSHEVYENHGVIVYKFFFNLKISTVQALMN
jgi:hypothetical protein